MRRVSARRTTESGASPTFGLAQPKLKRRFSPPRGMDRGPASRTPHDLRQIVDALDHRMPDLLERLLGELRLERVDEAGRRLARRVRDHVQLDRLRSHGLSVSPYRPGRPLRPV